LRASESNGSASSSPLKKKGKGETREQRKRFTEALQTKKKQRTAWTHGEIQFLVPVAAAKPRHAYAHAHAYTHARPAASWPIVHIPACPSVTAVALNYGVFARQAPVITATGHAIGFFGVFGRRNLDGLGKC